VCCGVLRCVAVCCSAFWCSVVQRVALCHTKGPQQFVMVGLLQCGAVQLVQCVAVCSSACWCGVVHCVAMRHGNGLS